MRFGQILFAASFIAVGALPASATLTPFFGPANLTAAQRTNAVNDDSTGFLAANGGTNFMSFDLMVAVPAGEECSSVGLFVQLSQGTMFQSIFEQPDPDDPVPVPDLRTANPGFWTAAPNRDLRADTFITIPASIPGQNPVMPFGAPLIAGRFMPGGPAGTEVFSDTELNIAYGETNLQGPGIFIVARITVSSNAVGIVQGTMGSSVHPTDNNLFLFTIGGGGLCPEPASLSMLAGAGLLFARRRK